MRHEVRAKRFSIDVQGSYYPSSTFENVSGPMLKAYAEKTVGSVGVPLHDYLHTKFFLPVDYTGYRNIFAIPEIQVEGGLATNSRFINVRLETVKQYGNAANEDQ